MSNYKPFHIIDNAMNDGTPFALRYGDIVLCRQIDVKYWKDGLRYKNWRAFVIVKFDNEYLVAKIIDHDIENWTITCRFISGENPDREIHLDDVAEIYNVIRKIGKFIDEA